jgi:hypothetical protein
MITEFSAQGRDPSNRYLQSAVVITDGTWHRVGLVWTGASRILYMDDVEVARDTLTGLPDTMSGLSLDTGGTLAPGTFYSGLIDDVRVSNRAVVP